MQCSDKIYWKWAFVSSLSFPNFDGNIFFTRSYSSVFHGNPSINSCTFGITISFKYDSFVTDDDDNSKLPNLCLELTLESKTIETELNWIAIELWYYQFWKFKFPILIFIYLYYSAWFLRLLFHLLYQIFFSDSSLEFLFFLVFVFNWFSSHSIFDWFFYSVVFSISSNFSSSSAIYLLIASSFALYFIIISCTLYFISWISSHLFSNSSKYCWSSFSLLLLIIHWFSLVFKCKVFLLVSTFVCGT